MEPGLRSRSLLLVALALVGAATVVWPFLAATTFHGDDHLFLTFARLEPTPFAAFVRDMHGGEYYRPLPMLTWWLLGRLAPESPLPFAALALILHAAAAALLGNLVRAVSRERDAAVLTAALFFVTPATRETGYWFSASTDLLAAVGTLGSLALLVRGRTVLSVVVAGLALLAKESAAVLPLLAFLLLRLSPPGRSWRACAFAVAPHGIVAALYVGARYLVLGGMGGAGDDQATVGEKVLQVSGGLLGSVSGHGGLLPLWLGWGTGAALLALATRAALRQAAGGGRAALAPLGWIAVACLPLAAAGWAVGARYFYLPAAGVAWLLASWMRRSTTGAGVWLAVLIVLGVAQGVQRRAEVGEYERRLDAARRAVLDGVAHGHRVFHVSGGIKDLDLAVKAAAPRGQPLDDLLVIPDVPASFALLPEALRERAAFLLAAPPLPPSGAYQFGRGRVVGLVRRGDEPDLSEVVRRLPEIRFVRLRPVAGSDHVIGRDVTDQVLAGLTD